MKNIKLLVSVYKAKCEPVGNFIVPVSAGAALYGKDDDTVVLRDDTGDNISNRNSQYCELTVQYWAWKNLECDVCGIMHRRRYFDFSENMLYTRGSTKKPPKPYRIFDSPNKSVLEHINADFDTISSLTDRYRVIAGVRENIFQSAEDYYNRKDRVEFDDMGLLREIIGEKYPEYMRAAEKYLNGKYSYFCNMFIMDKALFDKYSEWLFGILTEYEKRKPREYMYAREQGKIAERLFGIYMTYIIDETDISWAELPRAHFAKIDGATPKNLSFNKMMYIFFPPGSFRRGMLRKIQSCVKS